MSLSSKRQQTPLSELSIAGRCKACHKIRSLTVSVRKLDMIMLACFNASERSFSDWQRIFKNVDSRFSLKELKRQKQDPMAVIEAVFCASASTSIDSVP